MHEYSVARGLLRTLESLAVNARAGRVTRIVLQVGEFAGVDGELLQFACRELLPTGNCPSWDLSRVEVEIERVPLIASCEQCGTEFPVERFHFECRACGSQQVKVVRGEELVLDRIELEETM